MDVFPTKWSAQVPVISHPGDPRGFKELLATCEIIAIISFLEEDKIYFERLPLDNKLQPHFVQVGTASRDTSKVMVDRLSWSIFTKRMQRNIYEKKNTDIRVAYIWDSNSFLMKFGFTFGFRCVPRGCRHIYQTTSAPLIVYKLSKGQKIPFVERLFRAKDQFRFSVSILKPNRIYVLGEGWIYTLVAPQKAFFREHVVSKDLKLSFR